MPLVTNDAGFSGYGSPSSSIPHDWTEGTGVFPAGGVITIPSPAATGQTRKWLIIQNQSAVAITVGIQAFTALGALVNAIMVLGSGGTIGSQGGQEEMGGAYWHTNNQVIITGVAGGQVCVLEVLE